MKKQIDKKACRQFLEPLCPPVSDCGLFLVPALKYIIRTAVKIVGHWRLLVLCLYVRGGDAPDSKPKLAYTMFQASDSFITYDHDPNRKSPWRTAMLENLERDYYFTRDQCAFYSRQDEQRVLDFCKDHSDDGVHVLGGYQQRIRDKETKLRVHRRQKKVMDEFRCLRPLPKGVNAWLRRDVLLASFHKQGVTFYPLSKGQIDQTGTAASGKALISQFLFQFGHGAKPRIRTIKGMISQQVILNFNVFDITQINPHSSNVGRDIKGHLFAIVNAPNCFGQLERKVVILNRFEDIVKRCHLVSRDGILG